MKKVIVKTTVKINRVVYLKGSVITEPFPKGFQTELDSKAGTIELIPSVDVQVVMETQFIPEVHEKPENIVGSVESETDKKIRLRQYAISEFDVVVHHKSSLKKIEQVIKDLEEKRHAAIALSVDMDVI